MEETDMENEGDRHRGKDTSRVLTAHSCEGHTKVLRMYPKRKVRPVRSDSRIAMATLCTMNWKQGEM